MKKTIATIALLVSSSQAMALIGPGRDNKFTTICVKTRALEDGSKVATCDATEINQNAKKKKKLMQNDCPAGQISLTVEGEISPLDSCLPPGAVQL